MKNRNIPFGYEMQNGEIVCNVTETDAVKLIFSEYIAGAALSAIAVRLNDAKVPYSNTSTEWNKSTVKRVLDNVRYTGLFGFPLIIAPTDFDTAAVMKSTKYTRRNIEKSTETVKDTEITNNENFDAEITKTENLQPPINRVSHTLEITKLRNEFRRELDKTLPNAINAKQLLMSITALKYSECRTETSQ
jgi:hypothetical protein